jgi:hypothetical protein
LGVVRAAQGADAGEVGDGARFARRRLDHGAAYGDDVSLAARLGRDRAKVRPCFGQPPSDGGTCRVVDADHGRLGTGDQPLLDGGVTLHGAVPVEMIGRDVEEDADARPQRRRQIDLERRHLDDMDAVFRRRREG